MRAGDLRHRLTFQRKTAITPDTFGEDTEVWNDLVTVWGSYEPLSGNELLAAQQVVADANLRVKLRFYPGLSPRDRVQLRRWRVTAVAATDLLTHVNRPWGFANGERIRLANVDGGLPGGLALETDYFVRDAAGLSFKLAATLGGTAIDITSAGTGTHYAGVRAADVLSVLNLEERSRELELLCREAA